MNYWQIASGSYGRYYADRFIQFDMAFVGGKSQIATMESVELGDRILMKSGMSAVVAAGRVVQRDGKHWGKGDKEWLLDYDGWDLPAYCFVEWHKPPKPIHVKGLTRSTIQNIHQKHLKDLADKLIATLPAHQSLNPEPRETKHISDEAILEFLIHHGLRPSAAEDLSAAFKRIRLLARYYYDHCTWDDIREHETRTFLIIPLLLALGWAEQQIKIELAVKNRKRADVACFSTPYQRDGSGRPNDDKCVLILESKGFSQGLDYARDQAVAYSTNFPKCRVLVVTNGYCYKVFLRQNDGQFGSTASAYLNLLRPKDRYPLNPDKVDGCLGALKLLLPPT